MKQSKMELKETGSESVNWTEEAQGRLRWWAFMTILDTMEGIP